MYFNNYTMFLQSNTLYIIYNVQVYGMKLHMFGNGWVISSEMYIGHNYAFCSKPPIASRIVYW